MSMMVVVAVVEAMVWVKSYMLHAIHEKAAKQSTHITEQERQRDS